MQHRSNHRLVTAPVVTTWASDRDRVKGTFNASNVRAGRVTPIAARPLIPSALDDGRTIPVEALESDLLVQAPLVTQPGFETVSGHHFALVVNGEVVVGSEVVVADPVPAMIDLHIPKSVLDQLDEIVHAIAFQVTAGFGKVARSEETPVLIDRTPAGGTFLPRIIFSERVELLGLPLSYLAKLPDMALPSIVPAYAYISEGDVLDFYVRTRGSDLSIHVGSTPPFVGQGPTETRFVFTWEMLQAIPQNGEIDFYYVVIDRAGNTSVQSPSTPIRVLIKDAPRDIPAPLVAGMGDGLVTEGDIKPHLEISIPQSTPPPKVGDQVALRFADIEMAPIVLTAKDIEQDPMLHVALPYDHVWSALDDGDHPEKKVVCAYDIKRLGIGSPSLEADVVLNLDTPGGKDPVPSTPFHENLAKPVLRGATGSDDNVIDLGDIGKDAVMVVAQAGGDDAFSIRHGDVIHIHLDGDTVGTPHSVSSDAFPLHLPVPSADLKSHAGTAILDYDVDRAVGDGRTHVVASSPQQVVTIRDETSLPGGGLPMKACESVAAKRNYDAAGVYGVDLVDLIRDKGVLVRIYGWRNIVTGDRVTLAFDSYDAWDGGSAIPECSGHLNRTIDADDLIPKEDTSEPDAPTVVFIDLTIPAESIDGVRYGRIVLSYAVENRAGKGESLTRSVITEFRKPRA